MKLQTIFGEPSWRLRSDRVDLAVTRRGGQMAPVIFDRAGRRIQPFHISPFWKEKLDPKTPPLLQVLRGDFFCLPFGDNATPFRDERHPPHGESANDRWTFDEHKVSDGCHRLTLHMPLKVRRGLITKHVLLRKGHDAVYQEHVITGMSGPNCFGHHPNLEFRSTGHISVSPFLWGGTYPQLMESPENGSYAALKTGVTFRRLGKVPLFHGGESDLSIFPSRRGFCDVIQIVANPKLPLAWNTVVFPREGWLYFALRNPRTLRQTVMWFSHGGRHGAPWNGRHVNVLGMEDVTSFFAEGLAASARPNAWTRRGSVTALTFSPSHPTSIRYIFGVTPIPRGFTKVRDVRFEKNGAAFIGDRGTARAKVDWQFVQGDRCD